MAKKPMRFGPDLAARPHDPDMEKFDMSGLNSNVERDGWTYHGYPDGGDARKIVTLKQDGMVWVGIRIWNSQLKEWMNNNEPEKADVLAWKDLDEPARGFYDRGKLYIPAPPPGTGER